MAGCSAPHRRDETEYGRFIYTAKLRIDGSFHLRRSDTIARVASTTSCVFLLLQVL